MARPIKKGLDYFPLDCNMDDDIELFEAECGLEGFAILVKLWAKIYLNGYYAEWNQDNQLLFSKRINCDPQKVSNIVDTCLRRGIFNKDLHEKYHILTSAGIQKRYLAVCNAAKRKTRIFYDEYILLSDDIKQNLVITRVNSEETPINSEETPVNSCGKYTNKTKENKIISEETFPPEFELFYSLYPRSEERQRTYKNWCTAIKDCTTDELIQAAKNYKEAVKSRGKEFMKTSANFLGKDKIYKDYVSKPKVTPIRREIIVEEVERN